MDGANMNAQVGMTSPGESGADVCHLNLHINFLYSAWWRRAGVGPIGVKEHLVDYLPGNHEPGDNTHVVCSAPHGSSSINVIR